MYGVAEKTKFFILTYRGHNQTEQISNYFRSIGIFPLPSASSVRPRPLLLRTGLACVPRPSTAASTSIAMENIG